MNFQELGGVNSQQLNKRKIFTWSGQSQSVPRSASLQLNYFNQKSRSTQTGDSVGAINQESSVCLLMGY